MGQLFCRLKYLPESLFSRLLSMCVSEEMRYSITSNSVIMPSDKVFFRKTNNVPKRILPVLGISANFLNDFMSSNGS